MRLNTIDSSGFGALEWHIYAVPKPIVKGQSRRYASELRPPREHRNRRQERLCARSVFREPASVADPEQGPHQTRPKCRIDFRKYRCLFRIDRSAAVVTALPKVAPWTARPAVSASLIKNTQKVTRTDSVSAKVSRRLNPDVSPACQTSAASPHRRSRRARGQRPLAPDAAPSRGIRRSRTRSAGQMSSPAAAVLSSAAGLE